MCQNLHFNGFFHFAYYIKSWTHKKCNSADSESKSVKQNADHQNHLTVGFYMLVLYYHTVMFFGLSRDDWPVAMCDCLK